MIPTRIPSVGLSLLLIIILVKCVSSIHMSTITGKPIAFVRCEKTSMHSNPTFRQWKTSTPTWLKTPVQKEDEERLKNGIELGTSSTTRSSWNEEHLIHGMNELKEPTDEEFLEAEVAAAVDAHDCDDSGIEAVMMERAVVMAVDMQHQLIDDAEKKEQKEKWNDEHLVHSAKDIHEETSDELLDSEEAAAVDAHDCDDPGMEAAMMERAVMMAADMAHKMKEDAKAKGNKPT